jgi:hypothetical protein
MRSPDDSTACVDRRCHKAGWQEAPMLVLQGAVGCAQGIGYEAVSV